MRQSDFENEMIKAYKQLLAYARSLTHDNELAKDLLQDTILRILANSDKYNEQNRFIAWAKVVMRNTFLNNEKSVCRTRTFICGYDNVRDFSTIAVSECVCDYGCEDLFSTIYRLTPPYLSLFLIRRIEGYKYEEIAEELNIPIGTVKCRIHAAIKQLEKLLNR